MVRFLLSAAIVFAALSAEAQDADYGVDCSFPVHSKNWASSDDCPLVGRQQFYEDFMQSCRDHYGPKKGRRCDTTEDDRIEMSVRQPQSMVNYTSTGFKKIRAPEKVFDLLKKHWDANKHVETEEVWTVGNVYGKKVRKRRALVDSSRWYSTRYINSHPCLSFLFVPISISQPLGISDLHDQR